MTPGPSPMPTVPGPVPVVSAVRLSGARHRTELPLLVLGPSLGTSASTLWTACAAGLTDVFDVLAWDLPGHGHNRSVPDEPFTMAGLAAGVLRVVDDVLEQRGELGGSFAYAGNSVGGAVGLQLLLDAPDRVTSAVLLCTGAKIADAAVWAGRVGQVSVSGTPVLVPGSAERWFAPGFLQQHPEVGTPLLQALAETLDEGYVAVCEALAGFDVRDRLGQVTAPVLAVAGGHDQVTPASDLELVAAGVGVGELVRLEQVAHLAPAEAPAEVATLIRRHVLGEADPAAGGGADVEDFEALLAEHVGGRLPSRAGLDPRSRTLVSLGALVAGGHHHELAEQVRLARAHGLGEQEITEALLQTAVWCGAPAARAAYDVARRVLQEPVADE